ncbi:hypothetical protein PAMA_016613 [Pampus argenteus]
MESALQMVCYPRLKREGGRESEGRHEVAPHLRGGGLGKQVVLEGNRLVLTCLAGGSWPLQYRWTLNNSNVTDWTPQYSHACSIGAVPVSDGVCLEKVRTFRQWSQILGKFSSEEQRKTVTQGRAAIISPPPLSSFPSPVVTWYKDGHKIIPNNRIAITLDNQLVVLATAAMDAGRYHVEAVNEMTGENVTSPAIYLSISDPESELAASAIVIGPKDTTVVAGSETMLECIANARIEWYKDTVPLSRLANPRYKVTTATGLTVRRVQPGDGGIFQCFARNAAGETQAYTQLLVSSVAPTFTLPASDQTVTDGNTALFTCQTSGAPKPAITWRKGSQVLASGTVQVSRFTLLQSGGLQIQPVSFQDSGEYTCIAANSEGTINATAALTVLSRTVISVPPSDLRVIKGTTAILDCNATHDSRISVSYKWDRGGLPVLPTSGGRVSVRQGSLTIGQTWSGDIGDYTCTVTSQAGNDSHSARLEVIPTLDHYSLCERTRSDSPWKVYLSEVDAAMTEISVGGLTPARTYQFRLCAVNQVGRGQYSAETQRYRLAGLPGDYQEKNISSPETNYCLLKDLIIWTQYQIQVAAFTGAGLGVYSSPVTEYTLQGVPTAPPQEVEVVAINSTTIRFTWNPPPQQFINGINQGYKLLVWPEQSPEDIIIVTITPDYPGSRHTGLVSGLRKFTWYFGSTLCFTTPGDGPRSSPTLLQTHEDTPGPVRHLSFTEILDTSLRVSWTEPENKNGIITELPGAPSNLVISNISPRTATLKFRPGPDGKTAISRWIVEGQIVKEDRKEEAWRVVYQKDNQPDADTLEIPDLSPFTQYRFRMQQPLPESEYNSSPETVGYRLRVWRTDGQGDDRTEDVEGAGGTSEATVEGLNPWTQYQVQIQAYNSIGPGPWSNTVAAHTAESVPSGSPVNVTAEAVLYNEKDSEDPPSVQVAEGEGSVTLLLGVLQKYTVYVLQVLAYTRLGDGPPSKPIFLRTKEDVPGPPVRMVFPEVRLSSVRVVWQPPTKPNGVILGYQISYRLDSRDPLRWTTVEVGSNGRQFTVTGLSPEQSYVFRLTARTVVGWGEVQEALVVTTERRERPQPPRKLSVPQDGVESRQLRLHWVTGGSGSSPLRYFTLQIKELPSGDWITHTADVPHNLTTWTVDRLKPFTSYKLRMLATNDVGDSVLSKETEAVTTLQDVPDEPPVILAVKPTTTTSVLVQWKRPSDNTINGVLTGYRLYYRELPVNTSSFTEAEVQATKNNTTSALITTKSTFKTVSSASLTEFELTQLKKFKRYQIVMTSYNIMGESPPSTPVEVSVGEAAPSVAPQSIRVSAVSPSILEVTWDTPPLETQNGLIQGYKIHYWERDKQNQSEKVKVIFVPDTRVHLTNLTSYTPYMVTLTAFNTAGDGPASDPRGARTLQSAPSQPSYLTFSEVTGGSVNVSWGVPLTPNGQLEGYRVIYQPTAPVQGVSKVVTVDVKGSWQRWLKVRDLIKGATYMFNVQALTVSYGPPIQANITAHPVQGTPGSPIEMSITKTSSALTIHWSDGDIGAAPVTGYVIETRPSALSERPFYEEWWFLLVMALVGLILILVLVFALLLHGHSTKYKACSAGKHVSTADESVTLDNGGFTALELNSRTLNSKNSFLKKNGTRSPPRPSPGGLHYSDEDICNNYNGALTDSDYEDEQPKHSFVNHYMSDPTYFNSWKRQPKGLKGIGAPFAYEECATSDTEPYYQTVVTQHSTGGVYTPTGQPAHTHVNPNTNPPGSRTPVTGFSSFV